jgi:hypothetical protein
MIWEASRCCTFLEGLTHSQVTRALWYILVMTLKFAPICSNSFYNFVQICSLSHWVFPKIDQNWSKPTCLFKPTISGSFQTPLKQPNLKLAWVCSKMGLISIQQLHNCHHNISWESLKYTSPFKSMAGLHQVFQYPSVQAAKWSGRRLGSSFDSSSGAMQSPPAW